MEVGSIGLHADCRKVRQRALGVCRVVLSTRGSLFTGASLAHIHGKAGAVTCRKGEQCLLHFGTEAPLAWEESARGVPFSVRMLHLRYTLQQEDWIPACAAERHFHCTNMQNTLGYKNILGLVGSTPSEAPLAWEESARGP